LKAGLGPGQSLQQPVPRRKLSLAERVLKAITGGRDLEKLAAEVGAADVSDLGPAEGARALYDALQASIGGRIVLAGALARTLGLASVTPAVTEHEHEWRTVYARRVTEDDFRADSGRDVTSVVTERALRPCACGCGQPVTSARPEARYATGACRVRAHRARLRELSPGGLAGGLVPRNVT